MAIIPLGRRLLLRLQQPTRKFSGAGRSSSPIWSCSTWGLPCQRRCRRRGALLPHLFTLTLGPKTRGGTFSVALSVKPAYERAPPAVSRHAALRRPDFPLGEAGAPAQPSDHPPGESISIIQVLGVPVKHLPAEILST